MASVLNNKWQDQFARSFQSIKNSLLLKMRTYLPEVTDQSEGNIFTILISIFASIGEVIHYYIDNMARETFFITAKKYSSLIKHSRLVDYHIKAAVPASVDITINFAQEGANPEAMVFPARTVFLSDTGLQYLSTKQKIFNAGDYFVDIPVVQVTHVDEYYAGIIPTDDSVIYIDESQGFYAEGTATLKVNDVIWELVDTFAYSGPTDLHFKTTVDDNQRVYIEFGNGRFGSEPTPNGVVYISYDVTEGVNGNVGIDAITNCPDLQTITPEFYTQLAVTNLRPASGGTNYENFSMLKEHVPLHVRTLGVAITQDDYKAIAMIAPGVDKAYVEVACGQPVQIYIIPDGGGIASEALRDSTYKFMEPKKLLNTEIQILSASVSQVHIEMDVYGIRSAKIGSIQSDIQRAILDLYSYNNSDINKVVRLSDIYSNVMSTGIVDHVVITALYVVQSDGTIIGSDTCPADVEVGNYSIPIAETRNIIMNITELV